MYSSNGDVASRRSTICRTSMNNPNSPRKTRTYSHSPLSLSSSERHLRQHYQQQQSTTSTKSNTDDNNNNDNNRQSTRRASTVVQCFRHRPSSTITTIANRSSLPNTELIFTRRSISEERPSSSIETVPLNPSVTPTTTNIDNGKINSITNPTINSFVITENQLDEPILPAYIVETC